MFVCVQSCCLRCRHVFLISLFLGVMTSSPLILDSQCWTSMDRLGLQGPHLTRVVFFGQVYRQEPLLPTDTLRSGLIVSGSPVWQMPASAPCVVDRGQAHQALP